MAGMIQLELTQADAREPVVLPKLDYSMKIDKKVSLPDKYHE